MRPSTSITGCVRRSVGRSVGWSVTHSFDDPQVAPIGLLGLVILKGAPAVSESEKAVEEVYDLLRNLPKYKAEILKEAIDGKFL